MMIKHKNSVKHDPKNGSYGDCHRACFATILGLSMDEVPHFYHDPENVDGNELIREFLAKFNLRDVPVFFPGEESLSVLMKLSRELYPGTPMILGGTSTNNCNHSVVVMDGEIYNDPTDSGIIGPTDNGYYCLTFFTVGPNFLRP